MYAFPTLASLALLALRPALVHASVYVVNPVQASQCAGGQACQVQWVDNGEPPLLGDIGECQVGLYTGQQTLVQSLPSVDVSTTSSFSFTPDPASGPNGGYYIVFTSSGTDYQGFSGTFTLSGMTGTTPGGGSSAPASTPTDTSTDASTSAGSSTPAGTATESSASAPSGSSDTGTTAPTDSTAISGTTASPSPTLTTPLTTPTTTPVSSFTRPTTSAPSTSASATSSNAALRAGSSTSLSGVAALFALFGALAF